MSGSEAVFFWATTFLLAAAFFTSLAGLVFRRPGAFRIATWAAGIATGTLTVFAANRWVRSGHPPFVSLFESMTASVWFLLVIHQVGRLRAPQLRIVTMPLSGVAFLLMGWASSLPAGASPLSDALKNTWLFIHASFATSGAAAFVAAASLAVVYLLGERRLEALRGTLAVLPDYARLPQAIDNFVLFGLILWGVMIVSGSIWAHVAWGRYWAWDPIEMWSLISWLLYALLLHARMALRISKRLFFALTVAAAFTVVFALWGVHYVYRTIHTYG